MKIASIYKNISIIVKLYLVNLDKDFSLSMDAAYQEKAPKLIPAIARKVPT